MPDAVITVRGLSKKYRLGPHSDNSYRTVRESIMAMRKAPLRMATRLAGREPRVGERGHQPEYWALRDVNFELRQGEVLGIIGRNGAGKSTLLKVLSQITVPTEGEVTMKGRVASLLEVGTGFHPELTGRENVYLNGAILGMTRGEIHRKFDEIVTFSEVESFIDTPVKHYSSGMYLRLAFSVAAHLEPEILIVDEVLAVGDAAFQEKSLGKMREVSQHGRTVLFVSHSLGSIQQLCTSGMLLENGRVAITGTTGDVTAEYMRRNRQRPGKDLHRSGNQKVTFEEWYLDDSHSVRRTEFSLGESMNVHVRIRFNTQVRRLSMSVEIRNALGESFAHMTNGDQGLALPGGSVGDSLEVSVHVHQLLFSPADYYVSLWVSEDGQAPTDYLEDCMSFNLLQGAITRRETPYPRHVKLFVPAAWSHGEVSRV